MTKYCSFCNLDHELPSLGQSNDVFYWQPNKSVSVGGTYVCRDKKRQSILSWESSHVEETKNKQKRNRDKRRSTGQGRLRHSFSSLISDRLSGKSNKKTFDIVPYSMDELTIHLESKFKPGMTWNNYGKWHVDHIKPDCSFEYSSAEDGAFQDCWALNNLQPLWARDNKIKNGKI